MNILLGITGSIAAYKTPYLIRGLREQGHEVKVVLSQAAKSFVTPLTLQAVTGMAPYEELMDANAEAAMSHIALARWADKILIAPASAHFIAKLAHGFADDLLSTLCLVTTAPIVVAPAMNQQMWLNTATQDNCRLLLQRSVSFLGPDVGLQACGEEGPGRMMEPHDIIKQLFSAEKNVFLKGKKILITAGPTQEALDPVRYVSNHSSGKMGYALAEAAAQAGADVTLISGPVDLPALQGCALLKVKTANDMLVAVQSQAANHDIFISTAAVADFYLSKPATQKTKKNGGHLTLHLEPTIDILSTIREQWPALFTVGFAAETNNPVAYGKEKLAKKGVDVMVVNDVARSDIGFGSDFNEVTILSKNKTVHLPKAPKLVIARQILEFICSPDETFLFHPGT